MKKDIVFATCNAQPGLQASDEVLAAAFETLGHGVTPAPWNGAQGVFAQADAIIIRSTWDYHKAPDDFARWLDSLRDDGRVFNAPSLMRWNMSKHYLLDLAAKGAPLPSMRSVEPDARSIATAMDALGLMEAVVKPHIGATGSGLSLVRRTDQAGIAAAAGKLGAPGFVQALIPEIASAGETSLIFIAGAFTHAVTKRPKSGEILCQADHGGSTERASPPDWAIAQAQKILAMAPAAPFYARIDVVLLDGRLQLMEVELIEPELFFTYSPDAAARFAAALIQHQQKEV